MDMLGYVKLIQRDFNLEKHEKYWYKQRNDR